MDGFKEALELFLNNGDELRVDLLDPILNHLKQLYKVVENQDSFRFYSSSLLIMYGGEAKEDQMQILMLKVMTKIIQNPSMLNMLWKHMGVRLCMRLKLMCELIDFAHSTHRGFREDKTVHKGPDKGYLFGLQNLILMFEDIKKKYLGENSNINTLAVKTTC